MAQTSTNKTPKQARNTTEHRADMVVVLLEVSALDTSEETRQDSMEMVATLEVECPSILHMEDQRAQGNMVVQTADPEAQEAAAALHPAALHPQAVAQSVLIILMPAWAVRTIGISTERRQRI